MLAEPGVGCYKSQLVRLQSIKSPHRMLPNPVINTSKHNSGLAVSAMPELAQHGKSKP